MDDLLRQITQDGKYIPGFDGSYHQIVDRVSAIDWVKAVAGGMVFAMWRLAFGPNFPDGSFINNMLGMRAAGIKYRAAYIYCLPQFSVQSHFDRIVESIDLLRIAEGGDFIMPRLVLDTEAKTDENGVLFTQQQVFDHTVGLARMLNEHYGQRTALYVGVWYFDYYLLFNESAKAQIFELFEDLLIMSHPGATYEDSMDTINTRPKVPDPFYDPTKALNGAASHQFSIDENGKYFVGLHFGAESNALDLHRTTPAGLAALFGYQVAVDDPEVEPAIPPSLEARIAALEILVAIQGRAIGDLQRKARGAQ